MTNTIENVDDIRWLSPAKINRFLHITGQRADGYHLIESLFQTVDFADELVITVTPGHHDGEVRLTIVDETAQGFVAPSADDNLITRAVRLLRPYAKTDQQDALVDITLYKRIPAGGGLGGGSSNAATTLLVLNARWACGLSWTELQALGVRLGADVPFFLQPDNAWVSGIGEQIQPMVNIPATPLLLIFPDVSIPTNTIFSDPKLARNCPSLMPAPDAILSQADAATNVMEPVALARFPALREIVERVRAITGDAGLLRMTGSGSTFFYIPPVSPPSSNLLGSDGACSSYPMTLAQRQRQLSDEGISCVVASTTSSSSLFTQLAQTFSLIADANRMT